MPADHDRTHCTEQRPPPQLLDRISQERFTNWYRQYQYRKNIENGTPYFNASGAVPDHERHTPTHLLKCHRKVVYRQENAPEEQPDPDGLFWLGTQFEDELAFPFLSHAVTDADTYVRDAVWIDYTVETDAGEIRITGSTDPVIVDADAVPLLPTEIKTKSSLEDIATPNRTHRAQLHAYLVGLSRKYDITCTHGTIIYGSRKFPDVRIFHVDFDEDFWNDVVLEWAKTHTAYRVNDELPPAEPEQNWECRFCSFRQRCGKGDLRYSDADVSGFLPLFTAYPRVKVIAYLDSHDAAKLTPSLAHQYRDLAEEFGVYDWQCSRCGTSYRWDAVDWNGDVTAPPRCENCLREGSVAPLRGPAPVEQSSQGGHDAA